MLLLEQVARISLKQPPGGVLSGAAGRPRWYIPGRQMWCNDRASARPRLLANVHSLFSISQKHTLVGQPRAVMVRISARATTQELCDVLQFGDFVLYDCSMTHP